jgi:hypothetical protein
LVLIFTFPTIGEWRRFGRRDGTDKGVDEMLLMIGDGGFPNLVDPAIGVDLARAIDEFYSPRVIGTGT